ncbi:MAG: hypothetical protein ABSH25_15930 [Syntrophorhabdales bacterium]|jgi:hypothetical protein
MRILIILLALLLLAGCAVYPASPYYAYGPYYDYPYYGPAYGYYGPEFYVAGHHDFDGERWHEHGREGGDRR